MSSRLRQIAAIHFGFRVKHWFETEHLLETAEGTLAPFRYYFAQREAVETAI